MWLVNVGLAGVTPQAACQIRPKVLVQCWGSTEVPVQVRNALGATLLWGLPLTSVPATASSASSCSRRTSIAWHLRTLTIAPTLSRKRVIAAVALIAMASLRSLLFGAVASLPALAAAGANASYPNADMLRAQLALMGDRPDGCPPW